LSVPPASRAAAWKASTVARSGEAKAKCSGAVGSPSLMKKDPARWSPAHCSLSLDFLDAERRERLAIEAPARLQVANGERQVVDEDVGL
jgi:hypothetical protein